MNKKWVTSDLHYSHINICKGTSKWDNINSSTSIRDFKTVEEMNDAIVNSINSVVEQDDELYFLGDWSFGGIENIFKFWNRLICKNIYFIPGNHDQHIKKNRILPNVRRITPYSSILEEGEPISGEYPDYVEAQTLFKEYLPELYSMTYKGYKFIMSHYPLEQWEDMDRGSIMLFGHCHHSLDNSELSTKYRRKDVGWDGKIYSFDEIIEEMETREFVKSHLSLS